MTNNSGDTRLQRLTAWVSEVLANPRLQISVASADASFRRYFRARDDKQSWIIMDAPPEKENVGPYIDVANMLVNAGVNAPKVLAQNLSEGFLLLSDLGDRTYLTLLAQNQRVDELYRDALAALVQMQAHCATAAHLPPYDAALLHREMELFPEWLVGRHLGIDIDARIRSELNAAFSILAESALAQPRVFVHRDYHSRNLMVTDAHVHGPNPGVLDFQDAVYGPVTYDLVSLLRDCYIAWPIGRIHTWVRDYRVRAANARVDVGRTEAEFIRWFDLMGVQRHLKASGIFARLWHRDGKRGYLGDIPRTLNYICAVLPAYPELKMLHELIATRVLPALSQKS